MALLRPDQQLSQRQLALESVPALEPQLVCIFGELGFLSQQPVRVLLSEQAQVPEPVPVDELQAFFFHNSRDGRFNVRRKCEQTQHQHFESGSIVGTDL